MKHSPLSSLLVVALILQLGCANNTTVIGRDISADQPYIRPGQIANAQVEQRVIGFMTSASIKFDLVWLDTQNGRRYKLRSVIGRIEAYQNQHGVPTDVIDTATGLRQPAATAYTDGRGYYDQVPASVIFAETRHIVMLDPLIVIVAPISAECVGPPSQQMTRLSAPIKSEHNDWQHEIDPPLGYAYGSRIPACTQYWITSPDLNKIHEQITMDAESVLIDLTQKLTMTLKQAGNGWVDVAFARRQ